MADIRCSSCGKNNPDFLDRCQFCQSPLKPESMLHPGESPTKKDTGELEPILPDWLRDLHHQAKKSAEEEAADEAAQPKVVQAEPPDLLAGLVSQAGADDDEIPDWLTSIHPASKSKPPESPAEEPDPALAPDDRLPLTGEPEDRSDIREEKDELSEWFSQASDQPSQPFILERDISPDDPEWLSNLNSSTGPGGESSSPEREEDLSWLRELEASAKQPAEPTAPGQGFDQRRDSAPSHPSAGAEDLSWLNNLAGISESAPPFEGSGEAPAQDSAAPVQPTPQEDGSWLDNLGTVAEPSPPVQPPAAQEDLSWLNNLGQTDEPLPPAAADEISDWLAAAGKTSEDSQVKSAQPSRPEDLSWLPDRTEIDSPSEMVSPRGTAPLSEETPHRPVPEWLKSAAEEPSMPPLGAGALDWFASREAARDQPAAEEGAGFEPPSEVSPVSNQDVDSLFSIDMPDWLSQPEPGASEAPLQEAGIPPAAHSESLAPVELPSWVQAMRPVEAVISETTPGAEDQQPEREGPLAGLGGVIPLLPIGSSRRPKALSLTLQTTGEQQAGAALLEEILAAETTPRSAAAAPSATSQYILRWILAGLVIVVLGAMIGLRSRSMPVSSTLPAELIAAASALANIPPDAPVLVVLDYEAALAGEMEAVSGPLLNNLVLSRRSTLSLLSTSPNGPALAERLLSNTWINKPAPSGQGYREGEHYSILGYLPGGPAGVLAFVQSPQTALPVAGVGSFSDYAAVIVLTDHATSGSLWVEQLDARKQNDPALAVQPLLVAASAQAGPLLQPYVASRQVTGMITGLPDAAQYEVVNNMPPGIARSYWDTFGIGLLLAIILITFGSAWSLLSGIRLRRADAE